MAGYQLKQQGQTADMVSDTAILINNNNNWEGHLKIF